MVKIRADASQRSEVISLADIFRAKVVYVEKECLMVELTDVYKRQTMQHTTTTLQEP